MPFNTNTDIWLAGAFAAFSVDLLVYPLDTLKTRIQSPDYQTLYKTRPSQSTPSIPKPAPSTSARAFLSPSVHYNPALFRGLYQGISAIILVTIPSAGAFFTTYEALKSSISDSIPPNSTLYLPEPAIHAISSGGAELVSCAILTPAEVLKQNAQVFQHQQQNGRQRGTGTGGTGRPNARPSSPTLQVLRQFRAHPTKLFRGYTALAARNLPFTGLQFPLFEHLKTYFLDRRKRRKISRDGADAKVDGILERARITALSAGLAGTGAAWITTPIDVVKTRIMLSAGQEAATNEKSSPPQTSSSSAASSTHSEARRQTATDVVRLVLRTEGVRGMFRGALLRSIWTAFGSGLYLGSYEAGRHYLEERRRSRIGGEEGEGEGLMMGEDGKQRRWGDVKVGIGKSRSQGDKVGKSAWQD